MVDQNTEALRSAVAWALYLVDEQKRYLAAAFLAQALDVVSTDLPESGGAG